MSSPARAESSPKPDEEKSKDEEVFYRQESPQKEESMLIVMTAVDPTDLPPTEGGAAGGSVTIMLPADEFIISSAQLNDERRRKELGLLDGQQGAGPDGFHMAELQQGAPGDGGPHPARSEAEESWRAYYEHPLTAATSAMLNISGAGPEEQQQASMGFIYEYYKPLPQLADKELKGTPGAASAAAAAAVAAAAALGDLWPNSAAANPGVMTSHHHKSASANGLSVGGVSSLLVAPPPAAATSAGSNSDYSPSVTPAPPASAPPSNSPPREETAGSPRPRSASPELHGLFANSQAAAHLQQLQLLQHYTIKREPEDLSQPLTRKHLLLQDREKLRGVAESVLVLGSRKPPAVKDEFSRGERDSPHEEGLLLKSPMTSSAAASPTTVYASQMFAGLHPPATSPHHFSAEQYAPQQTSFVQGSPGGRAGSASYTLTSATDAYYRDYFASTESPYQLQRQTSTIQYSDGGAGEAASATSAFVERYVRQSAAYKTAAGSVALTVDLPSPDSGIGTDAITPRDQTAIQQSFDYTELCQAPLLSEPLSQQRSSSAGSVVSAAGTGTAGSVTSGGRSRPWHDFGRQNDADKVQIPKTYSQFGFKYFLETPISTSQRREDDRITYINKGQFYGITLEYAPEPDVALKCQTVKSVVMLMFREEKSPEDEIKAWQFWHGRQHSVKQRILDADTKNSVGLVGCIEEVAHNAIAVYWNPLESSAKINVAVQCLSTDFSSQKGVKGLPLHIQIDTYEDPREGPVAHRGYSQIKVFCDKGAERKTRDEERRAAKRKMTATGRKKLDELYHPAAERSEFYAMSDLAKPPVLFTPAEDIDKLTSMELQGFYGHETDSSSDKKDVLAGDSDVFSSPSQPPPKRAKLQQVPSPSGLHHPGTHHSPGVGGPPLSERVMLYVRQENEDVYTPLHVVPPSSSGLLHAIESKYKISTSAISNLYRKNRRGITARLDDDMLRYYCNEDLFVVEFKQIKQDEELFDVTLCEVDD